MADRNGGIPSSNGNGEGRRKNGRFAKGNKLASGNPFAKQVSAFRAAFLKEMTPEAIERIAAQLRKKAVAGEPWAIKEALDRTFGRSVTPLIVEDSSDGQALRERLLEYLAT